MRFDRWPSRAEEQRTGPPSGSSRRSKERNLGVRRYTDLNRFNATAQQLLACVTLNQRSDKRPPETRGQAKAPIPETTPLDAGSLYHAADVIEQPTPCAC